VGPGSGNYGKQTPGNLAAPGVVRPSKMAGLVWMDRPIKESAARTIVGITVKNFSVDSAIRLGVSKVLTLA